MTYNAIYVETREFVYVFEADDDDDAMNVFIILDPKQVTPANVSILQGPTQIDVFISNLCDAARGDSYPVTIQVPLIQGTPTFTNPFSSFYTATLREIRYAGWWIDCDYDSLNGILLQLNPSSTADLPTGVTIATPLTQGDIRPVYLYDPNGNYIDWWV